MISLVTVILKMTTSTLSTFLLVTRSLSDWCSFCCYWLCCCWWSCWSVYWITLCLGFRNYDYATLKTRLNPAMKRSHMNNMKDINRLPANRNWWIILVVKKVVVRFEKLARCLDLVESFNLKQVNYSQAFTDPQHEKYCQYWSSWYQIT